MGGMGGAMGGMGGAMGGAMGGMGGYMAPPMGNIGPPMGNMGDASTTTRHDDGTAEEIQVSNAEDANNGNDL
jgi:hypothetical protein